MCNSNFRASFVRQRQTEMSVLAVLTYLDSVVSSDYDIILSDKDNRGNDTRKTRKASNVITAQSFSSIFLADDKISSSNHMTEFWY